MDVLHKQVKPFMLRRLKTDVLDDLPPKILQDYFCDLSSIQCLLYEDFANKTKQQVNHTEKDSTSQNGNSATGHVFKVSMTEIVQTEVSSGNDLNFLGIAIFAKTLQSSIVDLDTGTSEMVSGSA